MNRLRLTRHTHCCFTPDGAILLDLRSDRYSAIPEAQSRALALLLGSGAGEDESLRSVADALLERNLVTWDEASGKAYAPLGIELTGKVLLDQVTRPPRIGVLHVVRFLKSCIAVHVALRRRSFEYAIHRATKRKRQGRLYAGRVDLERATTLVQIARQVRSFLFTAHKRCLYDSLVLADFLAQYGLYPAIVVGVATKPFRAHCWIQHAGIAFNSDEQDITQYTPLLAI